MWRSTAVVALGASLLAVMLGQRDFSPWLLAPLAIIGIGMYDFCREYVARQVRRRREARLVRRRQAWLQREKELTDAQTAVQKRQ